MNTTHEIFQYLMSGERTVSVDCTCDILDKPSSAYHFVTYMLDRTNQMFEYDGLPDTVPQQFLELMLQTYGSVGFAEYKGDYYAFYGHAGGAFDPYYRPTMFVVANAALGLSENYRIVNHLAPFNKSQWTEMPPCVWIRNDTNHRGLLPLFSRYATQMVENEISIRSAQINSRQHALISASTGPEIESARKYNDDIEAGKLSVVGERPFLDGIKVFNVGTQSANSVIQLIELQQYLKASWYNELGLNANFNMKREYMSEEEIAVSTDMLLPLVDDMLRCRSDALDAINKEFGLSISVDKNSAWRDKEREVEASLNEQEANVQKAQNEASQSTEKEESSDETSD